MVGVNDDKTTSYRKDQEQHLQRKVKEVILAPDKKQENISEHRYDKIKIKHSTLLQL